MGGAARYSLLSFLLVTCLYSHSDPFELNLRFKTIRESDPVEISCLATSKTTPTNLTIYWMRQYWGDQFIQERGVKSNWKLDFRLESASYQDGGRYECAATSGKEASDGSVNLTVTEEVIVQAAPRGDYAHNTVFGMKSKEQLKGVGIGLAVGVFVSMIGILIVMGLKRARRRRRAVKGTEQKRDLRKNGDSVVDDKKDPTNQYGNKEDPAHHYGNMPASNKGRIPKVVPPPPPGRGTTPNKTYEALTDTRQEVYEGLEIYENS